MNTPVNWHTQAIELRNSFKTSSEITKILNLNITPDRVRQYLSRNGHKFKSHHEWLTEHKPIIETLLDEGLKISDISTHIQKTYQFSISPQTLLKFLRNNHIPCNRIRRYTAVRTQTAKFSDKWLKTQIDNCTPIQKLAKLMSVSTTAVTRRLKEAKLKPYTKYPLWFVKEHWLKFKSGQEDGKYLIRYFSKKLSALEIISPAEMCPALQKIKSGGLVLEPFTWTGTMALASAKIGCKYLGIVHSPNIYSDIQKMVEFLGLKSVNIQYGELADLRGVTPDMVMISIPGLSVRIGEMMTTKKWVAGYLQEVRSFAEKNGGRIMVMGPESVKRLLTEIDVV